LNDELGEKLSADKDNQGKVDSKVEVDFKKSAESAPGRAGQIALPEVAQLAESSIRGEPALASTKSISSDFFGDSATRNQNVEVKQWAVSDRSADGGLRGGQGGKAAEALLEEAGIGGVRLAAAPASQPEGFDNITAVWNCSGGAEQRRRSSLALIHSRRKDLGFWAGR